MYDNLELVTLATHSEGYLPYLEHWSKKNNVKFNILAYGEKWEGWNWRLDKLIYFLEKKNENELILLIDGFDVLILSDKQELLNKFNNAKTDIILSCSGIHTSQPDSNWVHQEIIVPFSHAYYKKYNKELLNAGTYFGTAKSLTNILKKIKNYCNVHNVKDDQIALNSILLNDLKYTIDKNANVFWIWDLCNMKEVFELLIFGGPITIKNKGIDLQDKRIIFKKNGTKPSIVHGVSNRNMDKLTEFLDFPIKNSIKRDIHQKSIRYLSYGIKLFLIIFFLGFIIVIIRIFLKYNNKK